jgi:hypothetical protein
LHVICAINLIRGGVSSGVLEMSLALISIDHLCVILTMDKTDDKYVKKDASSRYKWIYLFKKHFG